MYDEYVRFVVDKIVKLSSVPVDVLKNAFECANYMGNGINAQRGYDLNHRKMKINILDNLTAMINRKTWKRLRVAFRNDSDFSFSYGISLYMRMYGITYQSGSFYIQWEELSIAPGKRTFRTHRKIIFAEKTHFVGREREWLVNAVAVPFPSETKSRVVWKDEVDREPCC